MLVEITIALRDMKVVQQLDIQPTESRTAESLVESKVRQLAKHYKSMKAEISWREVK